MSTDIAQHSLSEILRKMALSDWHLRLTMEEAETLRVALPALLDRLDAQDAELVAAREHARTCIELCSDEQVEQNLRDLGMDSAEVAARGRAVVTEVLSMKTRLIAQDAEIARLKANLWERVEAAMIATRGAELAELVRLREFRETFNRRQCSMCFSTHEGTGAYFLCDTCSTRVGAGLEAAEEMVRLRERDEARAEVSRLSVNMIVAADKQGHAAGFAEGVERSAVAAEICKGSSIFDVVKEIRALQPQPRRGAAHDDKESTVQRLSDEDTKMLITALTEHLQEGINEEISAALSPRKKEKP